MPGYEELTAVELITIFWGVFVMIMTFSILMGLVRPLINLRTAKIIRFHIDEEVAVSIGKELNKISLQDKIKLWWAKRKNKKIQEELYKPIELVKP